MTTLQPIHTENVALTHSFEHLDEAIQAYTAMRTAMTRMSLLNLELQAEDDVCVAKDLLDQFDDAVDRFLAANAVLERVGFWAAKDAAYMTAAA